MFRPYHWAIIRSRIVIGGDYTVCCLQRDLVECNTLYSLLQLLSETWWWPTDRAETCSLINKLLHHIILVVFNCTTPAPLYLSNTTGMLQLKIFISLDPWNMLCAEGILSQMMMWSVPSELGHVNRARIRTSRAYMPSFHAGAKP